MSGFAKGGVAIVDGANLAIAGKKPSGIAVQGKVMWRASAIVWKLLNFAISNVSDTATPVIDTTGANLIVAVCQSNGASSNFVDSSANSWTLGVQKIVGPEASSIFYCINPITSTSHAFVFHVSFSSICVMAFKCSSSVLVDQQSSVFVASGTQIQLSPITPSTGGGLVISTVTTVGYNFIGVDSGFNVVANLDSAGTGRSLGGAYLLQNNAATVAPTWTATDDVSGNTYGATATMLSFVPSPWKLLVSTLTPTSGGFTTPPIDTTGVTLLVAVMSADLSLLPASITDSQNNVWTMAAVGTPDSSQTNGACSEIFCCINPKTSTQHTFTPSYTGVILGFKGPLNITIDKNTVVGTRGSTSLNLPSLTPSAPSSLVITGAGASNNISSVSGGFTVVANIPFVANITYAVAAAYQLQATPSAVAPVWSLAAAAGGGAAATMVSFVPYQILNGLIDFWPMNEGAGNTFNNVVNSANPMTAQNITWAQNANFVGVPTPQFNGTTSGAVSTQNNTLNGPFSVCLALVSTAFLSGASSILFRTLATGSAEGFQAIMGPGNIVAYIVNDIRTGIYLNTATANNIITLNVAHHICVTYDGSGAGAGVLIYLDGNLMPTSVGQNGMSGSFQSNVPLRVGLDETGGSPLTGTLANARVYNRVLTQAEITALSNTMGK